MTPPAQLFASLVRRVSARAHRHERAAELDEELAFHAELLEREMVAGGMSARDARDAARRQIGNRTRIQEEARESWTFGAIDDAMRQLRMAFRVARRSVGYSVTLVLTLALGIGSTVTIYSVLDHVLVRPLSYPHSDQLMSLYQRGREGNERLVSYPTLLDWSHDMSSFDGMAYVRGGLMSRVKADGRETFGAGYVSPGFFKLMQTRPELGRTFTAEEELQSGADAIVLSHELWVRDFNADPKIVGRAVSFDSAVPTVVGVMPPEFAFPEWAQLWRPIGQILGRDTALQNRDLHVDSRAIGRLSPSASVSSASVSLSAIQRRVALSYPEQEGEWTGAGVVPLKNEMVGFIGPALWAFSGAVALILLIACVNLANLSAVRGTSRGREMAVRLALGASHAQVSLQLVVETLLLAVTGAMLGVVAAQYALAWLRATAPFDLPRANEIALDSRALLVAVLLTVATAVLFGVIPALRAAAPKGAIGALLGGRSAARSTRAQSRVRGALTITQFSLALELLVGAGLLLQSYRRLQSVDLGFDVNGLVTLKIFPEKERYASAGAALQLYTTLVERLRSVPGVEEAAFVNAMPPGGSVTTRLEIPGRKVSSNNVALYVSASQGYLRALRMHVSRGRWFTEDEMRSPGDGVVISESVAKRYWPNADALGKSLTIFRSSQVRPDFGQAVPSTVIGIVGDLRQHGPVMDPEEAVYVPMSAEPWAWGTLVVRTRETASASSASLVAAVKNVDPALVSRQRAAEGFSSASKDLSSVLSPRRYMLSLIAAFSVCALALAAVGIYGVTSYAVAQRTPELGIRRALGAADREIVRTVLVRGMTPALLGCVIGVALTFVVVRYVRHVLSDISSVDPSVLIAVAALLLGVGLAACYLPARRAKRVDPMISLRAE